MNLLNWWCKWTDSHGFGIFHQLGQDEVTHSYSVVSSIGMFLLWRSSQFSSLKAVPFGHTTFARTFWVAAYVTNHLGHFDLMQSNHSEVSLYTAAIICGWVSLIRNHVQCLIIDVFKLIAAASNHLFTMVQQDCPEPCQGDYSASIFRFHQNHAGHGGKQEWCWKWHVAHCAGHVSEMVTSDSSKWWNKCYYVVLVIEYYICLSPVSKYLYF